MTITLIDAFTLLEKIAEDAQTSGLMPGGAPTIALAGLVVGLQLTLRSGLLHPETPIEIDDIGRDFAYAVERMRLGMEQGR